MQNPLIVPLKILRGHQVTRDLGSDFVFYFLLDSFIISKNKFHLHWAKIAEKAVCKGVFLTIWQCIFSAELTKTHLTKTHFFRLFFGDFAHLCINKQLININHKSFWLYPTITNITRTRRFLIHSVLLHVHQTIIRNLARV